MKSSSLIEQPGELNSQCSMRGTGGVCGVFRFSDQLAGGKQGSRFAVHWIVRAAAQSFHAKNIQAGQK